MYMRGRKGVEQTQWGWDGATRGATCYAVSGLVWQVQCAVRGECGLSSHEWL